MSASTTPAPTPMSRANVCTSASTEPVMPAIAATLQRFVYSSSSSVYGDQPELPVTEQALPQPRSPYGVTKMAAEHLCVLYSMNFGVPTSSLRYFTVYGPRQRPDMAFRKFIEAALDGRTFEVYGDGSQTRDFTYVADAVRSNLLAVAADDDIAVALKLADSPARLDPNRPKPRLPKQSRHALYELAPYAAGTIAVRGSLAGVVIDRATGEQVWSYDVGAEIVDDELTPVKGAIYVVTVDGEVLAIGGPRLDG